MAALMCAAPMALHLPGRSGTTGVIASLALVACLVLVLRTGGIGIGFGLLPLLAPLLIGLIPFVVHGDVGIQGVSVNNDMSAHLAMADAIRYDGVFAAQGIHDTYPVGPHAVVALMGSLLGIGTVLAFAAFSLAAVLLLAMAGLAVVRDATPMGRWLVALAVAVPYLVASFYGQGAFKEVLLAGLLLAMTATFMRGGIGTGLFRWLPLGVILAGAVAAYSYGAVLWFAPVVVIWLSGQALSSPGRRVSAIKENVFPVLVAALGAGLLLVPQAPRVYRYLLDNSATNFDGSALGNLAGRIPIWEASPVWASLDFRYLPSDPLTTGVIAGIVLACAVAASAWWVTRGDWIVPLTALLTVLAWVYLDRRQTPYLAAKGVVILAPMLGALVVGPVVTRGGWLSASHRWRLPVAATTMLVVVLGLQSTVNAMRFARVGSLDHINQLQQFRADVKGATVTFLGNDDFVRWVFPMSEVNAPFVGYQILPTRPEKAWKDGEAFDVDSIAADALNQSDFLIAPNDPAGSALPPQFSRVRETRDFVLYRRDGTVAPRTLLAEGQQAAARLACNTPSGRAIVRAGGTAILGPRQVEAGALSVEPGRSGAVTLRLTPGVWDLALQYGSARRFAVTAGGVTRVMSANLDRAGPRYLAGTVRSRATGPVKVEFRVDGNALARKAQALNVSSLVAVRRAPQVEVPVQHACGKLVDAILP